MTAINEHIDNVEHVVGYEIVKDSTRSDAPLVRSYFVAHGDEVENIKDFIEKLILTDAMPPDSIGDSGPGAPPGRPESNLSINILNGNNLYLMRLANAKDNRNNDTQTKWGPRLPISFLPDSAGARPIKHAGLYHLEGGNVKFVPEAAISSVLDEVPDNAWLAFRCDIEDMRKYWHDAGLGDGPEFLIPFYFNLYDREFKRPAWHSEDDHDDRDHADGDDHGGPNFETHGGIHKWLKNVFTHGGIHRNMMPVLTHGGIHKRGGKTHGGIHRNSLVDYFYGGS